MSIKHVQSQNKDIGFKLVKCFMLLSEKHTKQNVRCNYYKLEIGHDEIKSAGMLYSCTTKTKSQSTRKVPQFLVEIKIFKCLIRIYPSIYPVSRGIIKYPTFFTRNTCSHIFFHFFTIQCTHQEYTFLFELIFFLAIFASTYLVLMICLPLFS